MRADVKGKIDPGTSAPDHLCVCGHPIEVHTFQDTSPGDLVIENECDHCACENFASSLVFSLSPTGRLVVQDRREELIRQLTESNNTAINRMLDMQRRLNAHVAVVQKLPEHWKEYNSHGAFPSRAEMQYWLECWVVRVMEILKEVCDEAEADRAS